MNVVAATQHSNLCNGGLWDSSTVLVAVRLRDVRAAVRGTELLTSAVDVHPVHPKKINWMGCDRADIGHSHSAINFRPLVPQ
jgi:hypothetical protein